jgi:hypothetical protein
MEKEIKVRAHQQLKAIINNFDHQKLSTIKLQGYADREELMISAPAPVAIGGGAVKLDSWIAMTVHADKAEEDWCIDVDASKLANRMPRLEGDQHAYIDFLYVNKLSVKGKPTKKANIVFNNVATAGKYGEPLPVMPLPEHYEELDITFCRDTGAIHFIRETGRADVVVHTYIIMKDFGCTFEAKAILSKSGITAGPTTLDEFAKLNKKEDTMATPENNKSAKKSPIPPPPGIKPQKKVEEQEELPLPLEVPEEPAAEDPVDPEPTPEESVEATEEEPEAAVEEPEAAVEEPPAETPEEPDPKPKKKRPSNSLEARIGRAKDLLLENSYEVTLKAEDEAEPTPATVLCKIAGLQSDISRELAVLETLLSKAPKEDDLRAKLAALLDEA